MEEYDAIVVGGGPAGCSAAINLLKQNRKILIVDRDTLPQTKNNRAEFITPRGTKALDSLDVLALLEDKPMFRISEFEIYGPDNVYLKASLPKDSGNPDYCIVVERRFLSEALLEGVNQLMAGTSSRILTHFEATDLVYESGRMAGITGTKDDTQECFKAKCIIAADGLNSAIRRRLGHVLRPNNLKRYVVISHEFQMKSENKVATFFDENALPGLVYVFFVDDLLIAHFLCEPDPGGADGAKPMELFERFLRSNPVVADALKTAGEPDVSVGYKNVPTLNQVCSYENVMFVGDAAPFVDPLSGEALSYAFRSGELAANVAVRALDNDDASLGAEYERAWKRELKQDITYGTLSHMLFTKRWVARFLTKRLQKNREITERHVGAFLGNLPKKTLFRIRDLLRLCAIRP